MTQVFTMANARFSRGMNLKLNRKKKEDVS